MKKKRLDGLSDEEYKGILGKRRRIRGLKQEGMVYGAFKENMVVKRSPTDKMEKKITIDEKHYYELFRFIHRLEWELIARKMPLKELDKIRDEIFEEEIPVFLDDADCNEKMQ